MKITIYQNREVYKEESKIGNDSENKVETLEFEFPEEYADFTKYIEFQIKGEKYVDLVEDNKYVITREVAKYGKIKTQLVLKKNIENDVLIFKSNVFELNVSKSINASENLVSTVGIDLIEKIVTKNSEQDYRLNTLEADNTTNKENILNLQNDNTTNKTNIQKNTYDITGIKEKDTNQDKLIEELQTKVVNLEAENVSLKNQIPSGEATGNPIHLTDSSNLECEIVVKGNAEQETRSGKNKFDKRLIESVINGTYENDILKNTAGKMNLQIVTSGITLYANTQYIVFKAKLESGTYSGGFSSIQCLDGNGFALTAVSNPSLSSEYKEYIFSKEITESKTFKNILFQLFRNTDAVVLIKDIMITTSNDTSYEPYGASPSPDYPSPVKTVGQNINELDGVFNKGYSLDNSGAFVTNSKRVSTLNYQKVKSSTIYSIKNYDIEDKTNKYFILCEYSDNNGTLVKRSIIKGNFTTQSTTKYIKFTYYDSNNIDVSNANKFTLYIGDINIEKFIDYGQGSVEIEVVNKNYFNFLDKSGNASGLDYSCNKNAINLNGTPSTSYDIRNIIETTKLKAGTYTFSANIGKFSISNSCQFHFRDKYNNAIVTLNLWGTGYKKTVTFEDDIEIDRNRSYFYTNKNVVFSQDKFVLQIEPGTVATEPVEHESYTKVLPIQKEFVKIGDYEDTFVKVDGKWYEAHYQHKIVFDGTENFILHTRLINDNYLVVYKYITGMKSAPKNNLLSNYFIAENASGSKNCIYGGYEKEFDISISKTIASTVDELKSKLAEWNNNGAPMELYYPLATPELIECTTEQEEILNSFYTYKNVTNISVDGIGTLKVNYKKDLETLFNNINSALLS